MRFHALKMQEINSTIKELWSSTYKGNGAMVGVEQNCLSPSRY
jgi:hypothetical protein